MFDDGPPFAGDKPLHLKRAEEAAVVALASAFNADAALAIVVRNGSIHMDHVTADNCRGSQAESLIQTIFNATKWAHIHTSRLPPEPSSN